MALRKGKDHLRLSVKACPYFGHVRNQRARAISERDSDAKLKITRVRPKWLKHRVLEQNELHTPMNSNNARIDLKIGVRNVFG